MFKNGESVRREPSLNLNPVDGYGETALAYVGEDNKAQMVKLLKRAGAIQ